MIVGERTLFGPWVWTMLQELRADQQQRWRQGDKVSVDAYVRRHPELIEDAETLCDLILGEISLREGSGEAPQLEEYTRRFPRCANRLTERYRHQMVTALPAAPTLDLPGGIGATLNMSPSHSAQTIQLDEAGQIAAQEEAFQRGVPRIPGYSIVCELGRGGMGVVYRAKQLSANRDVALKVVRNDVLDTLPMETRNSTLARFRHEAHAAARLEHDNLVPVYDVGEAGGLRYYAMRFVDGTSLYDMLRNKPLTNQDAARYIEQVARGLHFAHEQGVLHRDLKPHNIIVEAKSGRPMLTDFGLAKFLEDRNELTLAGDVMGTPSYMSPEQARDSSKVTASADVYSLGATLYHVLTSRPPFQAANVAETIRQVLDAEPVAPRRLNPAIDRDLETICLKCLQKEPARRYDSALALADDLKRYLHHEPILARPAGMLERTWRWCRRNPRLAGTAALASMLLVFWIGSMVSSYYKQIAARQKDHFLINDMFTQISEDELLNQPGMQGLRQKLLGKALQHYQELLKESGGSQSLQDEVAAAHYRVGVIRQEIGQSEEAEAEFTAAIEQQRRLLAGQPKNAKRLEALSDTLNARGRLLVLTVRFEDAIAAYSEGEKLRADLAALDPENLAWQRKLASIRGNLGMAELNQGLEQEGRAHIGQAQEQRKEMLRKDPKFAAARRDLAMGYFNLGRFESLAFYNLERPRPPEKASPAIENLREAVKQFGLLDVDEDANFTNRYNVSAANRVLGGTLAEAGQTDAALRAYAAAKQPMLSLAIGNPKVDLYQAELAALDMNEGELLKYQNELAAASEAWQSAQTILTRLCRRNPSDFDFRRDLASTNLALGQIELRGENPAKAVPWLTKAISQLEALAAESPDDTSVTRLLDDAKADLDVAQHSEVDSGASKQDESRVPIEPAEKNQ